MKRRYREKSNCNQIGIASIHGERIHDFLKGWGTLCTDGSILWDWWRPLTKRQQKRLFNRSINVKWMFPIIKKVMPTLNIRDLVNVQPMKK